MIPYSADNFGRKKVMRTFSMIGIFSLTIAALSTDTTMLCIAGCIVGFIFFGL